MTSFRASLALIAAILGPALIHHLKIGRSVDAPFRVVLSGGVDALAIPTRSLASFQEVRHRGLDAPCRGLWTLRFVGYLSIVPESDDPYLVFTNAIEEPVGLDVDFAVRKLRKLHDDRSRMGETREPLERFCRLLLELPGHGAIISPDRLDGGEKLHSRRWSEKNFHVQPSDKRASASASTCSRECPTPAAISFSPTGQQEQEFAFCFGPLISVETHQDGRRPPALGDEQRLLRVLHILQDPAASCLRSDTGTIAGTLAIESTSKSTFDRTTSSQPPQPPVPVRPRPSIPRSVDRCFGRRRGDVTCKDGRYRSGVALDQEGRHSGVTPLPDYSRFGPATADRRLPGVRDQPRNPPKYTEKRIRINFPFPCPSRGQLPPVGWGHSVVTRL